MRHAVISYNHNPDYIYYAPLVLWAWRKFNWNPVLMWVSEQGVEKFNAIVEKHCPVSFAKIRVVPNGKYRSATIAQICRLYAACKLDGYIMTADCDMVPLSDYWHESDEPTVWGFDLTGYTEYPISYIGMSSRFWRTVMHLNGIDGLPKQDHNALIYKDLDNMPNAVSDDFYKWWGVDQQLITQRLKEYKPNLVNRGQLKNGYARGRVDRGAWSLEHEVFIDAHLFHQVYHKGNEDKFEKTMELLCKVWPDEDWCWFEDYTNEFRKLTGHA